MRMNRNNNNNKSFGHISNTRKTLRILSFDELFIYMKLVFIKNLKNNIICERIFSHLLVLKYKKNSKSFIRDFKYVCAALQIESTDIINNIHTVLKEYKELCLEIEDNSDTELIKVCLENNQDYNII
jgi:hypothetical protein